jgi:hypothetical protein
MWRHISAHRATTKYFSNSLVSKQRLKRKDFQEIARLAWAQEVSGSNPDAPTTFRKGDLILLENFGKATGEPSFPKFIQDREPGACGSVENVALSFAPSRAFFRSEAPIPRQAS